MCFQNCAKYVLITLNILSFVAGGVVAVTGVLLLVESGLLHPDVTTLLNDIKYDDVKVGAVIKAATYITIFVGLIIMVVSVVGIIGAWKKIKCILILSILFIVVGILLQAVLVGLWINMNGRSDQWLKGELKTLIADYQGPTDTDDITQGFNKLFIKARCCGVDSPADIKDTPTHWYTYTGSILSPAEEIPATCCQGVETDDDIRSKLQSVCTTTPQDFYTEGCYHTIQYRVFHSMLIVSIVAGVSLIIQVAAILMSCIILDQAKNRIRHSGAMLQNKRKR